MTRRQAVSGLGVTVAAVALSPVAAIAEDKTGRKITAKLEDPTTKYPKPPFKYQPQPWPGLQSKMAPVPDCGAGKKNFCSMNRIFTM